MTSLTELFCHVDDFWQAFEPRWRKEQISDGKRRERERELYPGEIMTEYVQIIGFNNVYPRLYSVF
jgi:hypothetical protein